MRNAPRSHGVRHPLGPPSYRRRQHQRLRSGPPQTLDRPGQPPAPVPFDGAVLRGACIGVASERGRALLTQTLITLGLFLWAFAAFGAAEPQTTWLHRDEPGWIARGRAFGYFFLDRDFDNAMWQWSPETLDQPPGGYYVFGAGLWLQGHDLNQLNHDFHWQRSLEENRREGRVPTAVVLTGARKVGILFGAGTVALLYVVAVQLGAPLAGVVAALLAGASPYLRSHFPLAMSEPLFGFWLLAALALTLAAFRRAPAGFSRASAAALGSVLGLGVVSKLMMALIAPGVALPCLGAAVAARRGGDRRWWRPLAWGAAAALVCLGLFVALNPFLWPAPVERTLALFHYRQEALRWQQSILPHEAVHDPLERLRLVLRVALVERTWANAAFYLPLDVLLAPHGLVMLGAIARRDWRDARRVGPAAVFLAWLLSLVAGFVLTYAMHWERYALPLFLLAAVLSGLGTQQLLFWALGNVRGRAAGWISRLSAARRGAGRPAGEAA